MTEIDMPTSLVDNWHEDSNPILWQNIKTIKAPIKNASTFCDTLLYLNEK